jgi:photosystem II stability/assembly factor-like uncharacterized protein
MKKKLLIFAAIITLTFFAAQDANAQPGRWEQLNGPTGGFSQAIAAGSDGTIYLLTRYELWKRSPGSSGWARAGLLPFTLSGSPTQPLFAAYGKLFLMDGVSGMAVSTDQGRSWTMPNTWLFSLSEVNGTLYGIPWGNDAIARSTDSGATWKTVLQDTSFIFSNLTAGPSGKIYANGQPVAGGQGAIYTNVQGDSIWRKVLTPSVNEWNFITEVDNKICLVIPKDGYGISFYRTTDGGTSWDSVGPYIYNCSIAKDSSGVLWTVMGYPNQVMVSYDSGAKWIDVGFPYSITDIRSSSLCVSPSNDICLRTAQHVYHYTRSTQQWSLWEYSLYCGNIYALLPINDDSIVVLCNQGIYRTTNGGQSWNLDSMDDDIVNYGILADGYRPATLLRDREDRIFYSTSEYVPDSNKWLVMYDTLWYQLNGTLHPDANVAVVFAVDSSDNLYSLGSTLTKGIESMLRSTDHGRSWTVLSEFSSPNSLRYLMLDQEGRILGSDGNLIFRTTDLGKTWDIIYNNTSASNAIGVITVTQNGTILAENEGIDASGYFDMIESTDDGNTWQVYRQFDPWSFALDGLNKLYSAGLIPGASPTWGVLISTDTGKTGQLLSYSVDTSFIVVAVSPNHVLYAGTMDDGLFRYVPSSDDVKTTATLQSVAMLNIYPNPTTGLLHIESTSNDIVITDMLGRTRMRAVAGDGTIDVSGLPQGVYSIGDGKSHTQFVKE